MRILPLTPINFNTINKNEKKAVTPTKSLMSVPQYDSLSFNSTKLLVSRKGGMSLGTAKKIHKIAEDIQPEIENLIRGMYKGLIVTDENPKNLIEYIAGRAKTDKSIVEKCNTRGITSLQDAIHKITDLNATKIVIRDGSRKNVHMTLDILLDYVKRGMLFIEEIDVKRPKAAEKLNSKEVSKYDYADPHYIENFVDEVENATGRKIDYVGVDYTEANYPAIHFLLRLPGQRRVFELQLMAHNVAVFKDFDDILFKILNNKDIDPKYKSIEKQLQPILVSVEEKFLLKYIKIKEKLEKLKFENDEIEKLKSRLAMNTGLIWKSDTPEFTTKIKSLLKTKDIKEEDLSLLFDSEKYEMKLFDKEKIKELKIRADKNNKFKSYRANAFLFQREKKTSNVNTGGKEFFLPLSDDLDPCFDINNLYQLYLDCKNKG